MKAERQRAKRRESTVSDACEQTDGGVAQSPRGMSQRLDHVSLILLTVMMLVVPLAVSFRTTVVAGPIKYLIVRLMMFAIFSLWLFANAFEKRFHVRMPRLNLPVAAYAAVCVLASVLAFNPVGSMVVLHDLLWCVAIYVVVANGRFSERAFTVVLIAITCAAFVAAAFGVLQRFNLAFNRWSAPEGEPIGTPSSFGHRNFAAEYMVAFLPFVLALFWRVRSNSGKIVGRLLDACRRHLRRWEVRILAGCALMFLAVGPFMLQSDFREFMRDARTTFSLQRESNIVRVATWQSSADMALAHPVLGVGAGNYEVFLPEHWNMVDKERFAKKNRVSRLAHNAYLQIACEAGFLGLGAFTWIIATAFVGGLRLVTRNSAGQTNWLALAALCSVLVALVNGFFAFNLSNPATRVLFWFSLGCLGAAEKRSSEHVLPDK